MSNNIDAKYNTLGLFNYVGVQEDRELQFYNSYGITSTNIRDAENEFLGLFGYASGSVTDRWDGFLRSRGFTGSVDDMLVKFWELVTASLDLNFVNNNYASSSLVNTPFKNKSFNDVITFSRGTNATYVDSAGNIAYAPSNLLTYSEQFDNAVWAKTNAAINANTMVAPDGNETADYVVRTSTTLSSLTQRTAIGITGIQTCTASIYAKAAATGNNFALRIQGVYPSRSDVVVDLLAGDVLFAAAINFTLVSVDVLSVGNGWYRISTTATSDSTGIERIAFGPTAVANGTWESASTTLLDAYAWGAQLNLDGLQPYNSTTVKNLLGYTQDFDNAAWTKSNSSITQNVIAAPDGSLTADKLVEDTATSSHFLQSVSLTAQTGTAYTFSCYAKAAGRSKFELLAYALGLTARGFDLSNGTTFPNTAGLSEPTTSSITLINDGWYRCSVTANGSGVSSTVRAYLNNGSTFSYTGDGTSGIYIWGAQLSDSASLDPYSYNFTTAPTAAAYYGPRFDYDPVTLACKGLLIEEQRTNLVTYSDDLSNYQAINNATVATNVVNAPDGLATADSLTATLSATSNTCWVQKLATIAANTSAYTAFAFVKEGSSPTTAINLALSGGTYQEVFATLTFSTKSLVLSGGMVGSATGAVKEFSNGWYQVSVSFANNGTNTVAALREYVTATSGSTVGFYTYFWGLQLEAGAFPTSYIPTTTTEVTRAADVAVIQGANFSNWYNQSEGTLFAETQIANLVNVTSRCAFDVTDGGTANRINVRALAASSTFGQFTVRSGGATTVQFAPNSAAVLTPAKLVFAYKDNDFAGAYNGTEPVLDSVGAIPLAVNTLLIGSGFGPSEFLNGHIARIAYYPRRLADTDLTRITK